MIGYLLTAAVVGVAGLIGYEKMKPTGSKVQDGDSVFVNATSLRALSQNTPELLALKVFLDGFMATNVKVSDVRVNKPEATGTVIGFPGTVAFPLSAVTSIDRNGKRIV